LIDRVPSKSIGGKTYIHVTLLPTLDRERAGGVAEAERLAGVSRAKHFDLVRFDDTGPSIALLAYPRFFEDPFPALQDSWLVDLERNTVRHRSYSESLNPPILHRKELLLPNDHPEYPRYAELTATAESIGLFDEPMRIGYQRQWLALIREKGYRIDGHQLVPVGNDESAIGDDDGQQAGYTGWQASRQLTALVRYGFSAPVQSLARYGFISTELALFDYGCGRGDDVRGLVENGIPATGWDPYYAPDQAVTEAEVVNLGFVINVIEDFDERVDALTRAYSLARSLLVVSVMLANQNDVRGERFRDGVLTRRGTFQKYYTQTEIKGFIEEVLDQEPIPVAPGVLYVFRDKDAEQRFLVDRYRSRRTRLREPSGRSRPVVARPRRNRAEERYQACREPLDRLWQAWLALGRRPHKSEVDELETLVAGFGTLGKALRFIEGRHEAEAIEHARGARIADLEVYLALAQFERRRPYKHLEPGLQRDIKAFFGNYAGALAATRDLLFRIADADAIAAACADAAEQGLGWLQEDGAALQLHVSLVEQLPTLLRVTVACAALLYGDYHNADLVKIHVNSGKVSLMRFDDFTGQPLPRMLERVKIKLREQRFDYFGYGADYEPPLLYRKSRYINEEFSRYPEQLAFDEALQSLGLIDGPDGVSTYGPSPSNFSRNSAFSAGPSMISSWFGLRPSPTWTALAVPT